MNPLIKELRKRSLDRERLQVILDEAVPRMIAWDRNHPAPSPKDAEALRSMDIPDYVKKAVETSQQEQSGAMDSREPGYNPRKQKGHGGPRP